METFGRYQLVRKLATGGMGQVFLARQQGPVGFEKLLVVKRILPHLSEENEFIQMFFDEARIAAALNHPNIAQIYELGEVSGNYFIAMEYVEGAPLRAVGDRALAAKGGFPLGLKLRIIADTAAGLDFAHQAKSPSGKALGLIHRDVSPHNILVGFNGGVKLIDFGVARATGKISHTDTGNIKGKYAYMSPEQARGEEIDRRSDIFGLGIVLHEVLTGQRLFKRDSEPATMRAVIQGKIAPPSTLAKDVPKALDAIALKALARKRDERYRTAADLQLALEDFLQKSRLHSTSAHLAAFMRDLYADEIADVSRSHEETAVAEAHTPSASPAKKTPSRKTFDQIVAEREAQHTAETRAVPLQGSIPVPSGSLVQNPAELQRRISATSEEDRASGLLFNAVLNAVIRCAGPIADSPVRAAAEGQRLFRDELPYPTADLLRVLWKAGEVVAPMCDDPDRAFVVVGAACFDVLFTSAAGESLRGLATQNEPEKFLSSLAGTIQGLINPGSRRVEDVTAHEATLRFDNELLPGPFFQGLFTRGFEQAQGQPATAELTPHEGGYHLRLKW